MSKGRIGLAVVALAGMLSVGCGDDDGSTGLDAGPGDAGCTPMTPPTLPTEDPPTDITCTTGAGPCCYIESQADSLAEPELRLRYLKISAPQGSQLTGPVLLTVLNQALERGTFAWLMQVQGADADGDVTVRTGFGLAHEDGTFSFPTGTGEDPLGVDDAERYGPAEIPGTITGERVTTQRHSGSIIVPVLNEQETEVQLELELRNIQLIEGEFNTDRSCVGWQGTRGAFQTAAILDGFIEVESARQGMVVSGTVSTTVCAAIAGLLTEPQYCEMRAQNTWMTQPDSLCTDAGCTANADCEEDVCDRGGDSTTGLPACNAWRLVAEFAAQGIEITN